METKVIRGGTLIDGTGRAPVKDSLIVVKGKNIVSVGRLGKKNPPEGEQVKVIDARGKTVMPGLIDGHLHMGLGGESRDFYSIPIHNNGLDLTVRAIPYLKKTLDMGFTTIRDGGSGYGWMEVALRNGINRGDIIGPRYLTSGYHLTVTGGHGYFLPPWFGRYAPPEQIGMHCDGPEEWRRAARLNLYNGVDNIKVVASRGFLSAGLRGDAPPMGAPASIEEMRAAVDEAHRMGKKAIAHANGPEAIMNAIEAGVDSIIHGFYMNERCAERMVKRKVILEPTTLCIGLVRDFGKGHMLDAMVERATQYWEIKKKEFRMILDMGVTISFASDMGCPYLYHGENARELACCVELGMTPMAAIVSATKTAAQAVGLEDKIGTVKEGKLADLLLVEGDPLRDIELLGQKEKIKMVMKEGEIIIARR